MYDFVTALTDNFDNLNSLRIWLRSARRVPHHPCVETPGESLRLRLLLAQACPLADKLGGCVQAVVDAPGAIGSMQLVSDQCDKPSLNYTAKPCDFFDQFFLAVHVTTPDPDRGSTAQYHQPLSATAFVDLK